jgi:prepilin-type N-terminal cleavage/methylation domain-containing protein/prepilin-type processing-associated H-X9-DG protein
MKTKQTHKLLQTAAGFTLTELLVVILIVAVLAALSLVGVRSIRENAQTARCSDNLRTWGIAIHGYAAENNGSVQWNNWASISNSARYYETYLGGDLTRATATMDGKAVLATQLHRRCPAQKWDGSGNGPVGYAMTRPNPKIPSSGVYNLSTASNPSQLLMMMDANVLTLNGSDDIAGATTPLFSGNGHRHRQKVNALFGDGHVSAYHMGDLKNKDMLVRWFTLR